MYLDVKGRFHIYPHDSNEAFFDAPANIRGAAARGTELDPFIGSTEPDKVLLSRLVAVPALRTRYLQYVKGMTTTWLDWQRLGPLALKYQALIEGDVQADTRKLDSYDAFRALVARDYETKGAQGPVTKMSLKTFADQRRAFLLNYPAITALK